MAQLHETIMGKRFIEHTLPEIALQLERIADSLEDKKADADQVSNAYRSYVREFPNDADLGKAIRALWEPSK